MDSTVLLAHWDSDDPDIMQIVAVEDNHLSLCLEVERDNLAALMQTCHAIIAQGTSNYHAEYEEILLAWISTYLGVAAIPRLLQSCAVVLLIMQQEEEHDGAMYDFTITADDIVMELTTA